MTRIPIALALVVVVVVVVGVDAVSLPVVAFAQDSPSTPEDLLEQAIRLREQRRDVEALPLFRRAYEMWPSPRTEAQLGLAHQAVGDWPSAYRYLAAALAAPTDPWIAARRGPLEEARRVVRAEVALVTLRGGPPGGEVVVAGRVVATLPTTAPVAVAPGRVTISLRAPGHLAQTRTFDIARGQQIEQSAELQTDPSIAAAPTTLQAQQAAPEVVLDAPLPTRRRARRRASGPVWAWVATGAAAAMAAGAGIAWWQAGEGYAELEDGCGRTRSCSDAQIDRSGASAAVTWTNVLLVGSAVAATGAVILFVVEPSSGEPEDDRRGRARAAVGIGPGSIVIRGRF